MTKVEKREFLWIIMDNRNGNTEICMLSAQCTLSITIVDVINAVIVARAHSSI